MLLRGIQAPSLNSEEVVPLANGHNDDGVRVGRTAAYLEDPATGKTPARDSPFVLASVLHPGSANT